MLLFYDGHCATCHLLVRFLLRRARRQRFRFVALQSLKGQPLEATIRDRLGLDLDSSLVVWKKGVLLSRAAAVFAIFAELGFPWILLLCFRVLPLFVSNAVYDLYARNRYRILGAAKNPDLCSLVPPEQRALLLDRCPDLGDPTATRLDKPPGTA